MPLHACSRGDHSTSLSHLDRKAAAGARAERVDVSQLISSCLPFRCEPWTRRRLVIRSVERWQPGWRRIDRWPKPCTVPPPPPRSPSRAGERSPPCPLPPKLPPCSKKRPLIQSTNALLRASFTLTGTGAQVL